jgi:hypothetical protein
MTSKHVQVPHCILVRPELAKCSGLQWQLRTASRMVKVGVRGGVGEADGDVRNVRRVNPCSSGPP